MKNIILILAFIASASTFAGECKDPNFNGLSPENYDQLQYHSRFTELYSGDSAAPAGFSDYFGITPELCFDVEATYLKHKDGKVYVMFTTHDDYCDGGNTLGIVIDLQLYKQQKLDDAIVAEIGDSELYCR